MVVKERWSSKQQQSSEEEDLSGFDTNAPHSFNIHCWFWSFRGILDSKNYEIMLELFLLLESLTAKDSLKSAFEQSEQDKEKQTCHLHHLLRGKFIFSEFYEGIELTGVI